MDVIGRTGERPWRAAYGGLLASSFSHAEDLQVLNMAGVFSRRSGVVLDDAVYHFAETLPNYATHD